MTAREHSCWTMVELGERVEAALAEGYDGPANGRVRAVPDERTIRYYTTLGLIDRPGTMRGRTALYGPRHLRQIVAIKRLQARGHSLAEVQARLSGLADRSLAALAAVPDSVLAGTPPAAAPPSSPRRRGQFWKVPPAKSKDGSRPPDGTSPPAGNDLTIGLPVGDGVVVLLPGGKIPTATDLAAARRAAAPLLRELATRGLTENPEGTEVERNDTSRRES